MIIKLQIIFIIIIPSLNFEYLFEANLLHNLMIKNYKY